MPKSFCLTTPSLWSGKTHKDLSTSPEANTGQLVHVEGESCVYEEARVVLSIEHQLELATLSLFNCKLGSNPSYLLVVCLNGLAQSWRGQ